MLNGQIKNNRGFTLVEMLIAMVISAIILTAAIYTYTQQDTLLREENTSVHLRDYARLAMDDLVANIRLAGAGFPPGNSNTGLPARAILTATATTLTYGANTDEVSTFGDADITATNATLLPATDPAAAGFNPDDNVVFFDVRTPTSWNTRRYDTLLGAGPFFMGWGAGTPSTWDGQAASWVQNDFAFLPVSTGIPTAINNYHVITYTYSAIARTITMNDDNGTDDGGGDDTSTIIATNVSNLTFSYFDSSGTATAVLGNIRKVQVSFTVVDATDTSLTATLVTDIHLRNMGI